MIYFETKLYFKIHFIVETKKRPNFVDIYYQNYLIRQKIIVENFYSIQEYKNLKYYLR